MNKMSNYVISQGVKSAKFADSNLLVESHYHPIAQIPWD